MSPRLPRVSAIEVIKVLEKIGFMLTRQSGSHKIYKNSEGKRVTVPYHGTEILKPKTLRSILNDASLTVEEFINLLQNTFIYWHEPQTIGLGCPWLAWRSHYSGEPGTGGAPLRPLILDL